MSNPIARHQGVIFIPLAMGTELRIPAARGAGCSSCHQFLTANAVTRPAAGATTGVAAIRPPSFTNGPTDGSGGGGAGTARFMAAGQCERPEIVAAATGFIAQLPTRMTTTCKEVKKNYIIEEIVKKYVR